MSMRESEFAVMYAARKLSDEYMDNDNSARQDWLHSELRRNWPELHRLIERLVSAYETAEILADPEAVAEIRRSEAEGS
jgi:hypothetical protein